MTDAVLTAVESPGTEAGTPRDRSRIGFPYNDLTDAISVAQAVHDRGDRCSHDQLIPTWNYSNVDNGAYLLKLATARHFGLITSSKRDGVALTALGQQIVDPTQAAQARATAFLNVPLYETLYNRYRGHTLPTTNIGLETVLVELGVAPKQKDKARQALQRSAEQAGFFAQGRDRLVAPSTFNAPVPAPDPSLSQRRGDGGGNQGGDGPQLPTLVRGLIEQLPEAGSEWASADREQWLTLAKGIFAVVYKEPMAALPAPRQTISELSRDGGAENIA